MKPYRSTLALRLLRHSAFRTFVLAVSLALTTAFLIPSKYVEAGVVGIVKYDTSFGLTGLGFASGVAIQPDGKIVAVGGTAVTRFTAAGSVDWQTNVVFTEALTSSLKDVAFQPDGKIVVVGEATISSGDAFSNHKAFAVARLNSDGSLDTTFSGDGRLTTQISVSVNAPIRTVQSGGGCVLVQPDGKIVVGGRAGSFWGSNSFPNMVHSSTLVRYTEDGSLDTSFDDDGIAVTSGWGWVREFTRVQIQPDGKLVAVNMVDTTQSPRWIEVYRFNENGSLDSAFGENGRVYLDTPTTRADIGLYPDGKVSVSGSDVIHRLQSDGTPDTSFGGDGKISVPANANPLATRGSIAVRPDGKIVRVTENCGFEIYNADGTLYLRSPESCTSGVLSFVLDSRNRVVAAGGGGVSRYYFNEAMFDRDGNGYSEPSVFRPSSNAWYSATSTGYHTVFFGESGDKIVPADYDGNGSTDTAVWRPSTGTWYLLQPDGSYRSFNWGEEHDIPTAWDRNGDGKADLVIFRPSTGTWYFRLSSAANDYSGFDDLVFGTAGDRPVVGDFDNDGRDDAALFRASENRWYVNGSTTGAFDEEWGQAGDVTVPADYDGDGATDIAIYRPTTGQWWAIGTTAGWMLWNWGEATDIPAPADYDGDGKSDVAVFRPSTGTWYIVNSVDQSISVTPFGEAGDVPLPSAFVQ